MIKYNRRKRLKKKQPNLQQSNNNNYPSFPTLSSYFSPPPGITKTPTPSSILIKQIKNNSNSIRLLNKKKQKVQSQSHQQNTGNTSQLVLRNIKGHSPSRISSLNEIDNKSIENKTDSSSSYCISSNSELSENQNIFIPNLSTELKALTTTNLQSPSNSIDSKTQNDSQDFLSTTYPSITIPSGIAKLILLDSKKNKTNQFTNTYIPTPIK